MCIIVFSRMEIVLDQITDKGLNGAVIATKYCHTHNAPGSYIRYGDHSCVIMGTGQSISTLRTLNAPKYG